MPLPTPGDTWRLLYVGQLVALKGVNHLLEALAVLQRSRRVELDLVYHVDTELPTLRRWPVTSA